jgi:drug/metabolite transporter (DMT)-like permease
LAWLWLGERLSRRGILGFALAIGGLLLIVWPQGGESAGAGARLLGDAILNGLMGLPLSWARRSWRVIAAAGHDGGGGARQLLPFAAGEWPAGGRHISRHWDW